MARTAQTITNKALLCVALFSPQSSPDILATYEVQGHTETISRNDLILDLARRHRHSLEGVEARQTLVDRVLIQRAAEARGLMPDANTVAAKISEIEAIVQTSGEDMDSYLHKKSMSREVFVRDYIVLVAAHERLVRAELELSAGHEVSSAQLQLWLKEERASNPTVTDPKRLPESVAAKVGDEIISSIRFGEILLETMDLDDRRRRIQQIILARLLAARARSLGIEVSDEDAQREVLRTKREVEANPNYQGVPYERLLAIQGTTLQELAKSEVTIANIQQRRIVLAEHSEASLRKRLQGERAAIAKRHGPKRTTHIILLRATDVPNEILTRNYEDTLAFAQELRGKINRGSIGFADAARFYSEEPNTKSGGGKVGPLREVDGNLPGEVMEAVFRCKTHEVPEPIRVDGGVFLVWVTHIGENPSDDQLIAALRSELAAALQRELFATSQLHFKF